MTIGMATANDYDGVYFTIQAIRLYHSEILSEVEFLLLDNNPSGPCAKALRQLEDFCGNLRYFPYSTFQGTSVRDLIFREAAGDFVICVDSHVLFAPGSLARFIEYSKQHPDSNDLLQGPLLSDALEPMATHFEPVWSQGMYGQWGLDDRGKDPDGPPFEIGMQGLGVFGCRREAWPGFNPRLAGFGGEEGYIHEKIRRAGGRNLCLPFLRWMHRFQRPMGIPYPCSWEDRIRNYLLVHNELGWDPAPVIGHFKEFIGKEVAQAIAQRVQAELAGSFHFFDAIYCINRDTEPDRWETMQPWFRDLGIERRVRRFSAADSPPNLHIACALTHRRIVAEAKRQHLKTILVLEDNDLRGDLTFSPRELEGCDWQVSLPGGAAIAYHHTVYDALLNAVPDEPTAAGQLVASLEDNSRETMPQLFRQLGVHILEYENRLSHAG